MKMKARFLAVSILFLIACGKQEAPKPAPATVTISTAIQESVVEWDDFSGRLESPKTANIAARISGVITQAPFEEGSLVHEGDLLFLIDDRPFQATLASKRASVQRAQALLAQAQVHYNRYSKIKGTKAISEEDFDQAGASLKQAQAELAVAKAAEDSAKLELEWTRVTAPITGRVSRKYVTEGNLVSGGNGQATLLTVITSVDPLYAVVAIPERFLPRYQKASESQAASTNASGVPCRIQLENEDKMNERGCTINFIDSRVEPNTGTVIVRGTIPNQAGTLTSGLFIRMQIRASTPRAAILVPDSAIISDQNGRALFVLGAGNVIEQRTIIPGSLFGRMREIKKGLQVQEKFVTIGLQSARAGALVNPTEAAVKPEYLVSLEPYRSANTARALSPSGGPDSSVQMGVAAESAAVVAAAVQK